MREGAHAPHGERHHPLCPHPDGATRYRDVFWLGGPLGGPAARAMLAQVRVGMAEAGGALVAFATTIDPASAW